jgi:hypothetical protein
MISVLVLTTHNQCSLRIRDLVLDPDESVAAGGYLTPLGKS